MMIKTNKISAKTTPPITIILNILLLGKHAKLEFSWKSFSHSKQASFLLQARQLLLHYSHLSTTFLFSGLLFSAESVESNHLVAHFLHTLRSKSHTPQPSSWHFKHFFSFKIKPGRQTVHSSGVLQLWHPAAHSTELLDELPEELEDPELLELGEPDEAADDPDGVDVDGDEDDGGLELLGDELESWQIAMADNNVIIKSILIWYIFFSFF